MNGRTTRAILFCLLLATSLSLTAAAAGGKGALTFRIAGKERAFRELERPGSPVLSESCFKSSAKPECEAERALGRASLEGIEDRELSGGKNPGSAICRKALHGKVVIGTDASGNEWTFCLFADGSMVNSGALLRAASDQK